MLTISYGGTACTKVAFNMQDDMSSYVNSYGLDKLVAKTSMINNAKMVTSECVADNVERRFYAIAEYILEKEAE